MAISRTFTLKLLLFLTLVVVSAFVNGQQLPQPFWQRAYGGYGDDNSVAFTRTYDKGFVVVGYSYQSINGDVDNENLSYDYYAWVVKLDSNRNVIWQRKIRRVQSDAQQIVMKAVIQTKDSGIVVLGAGDDDPNPQFAIKYDKNGKQLWKYAPPSNGRFTDFSQVMENPDGSLVICGSKTLYLGNDSNRGWLLFLNPDGTFKTEKLYLGVASGMQFTCIDRDFGGGYILGGISDSLNGNVLVVKIAPDTAMTWYRSYGGEEFDVARDVLPLPDNTYMVASSTNSNDADVSGNHCIGTSCPEDAWMLKINQSGAITGKTIYGDFDNERVNKLIHYKNGVLMVGYSNSYLNSFNTNRGGYDVWTVQLDYNLNRQGAYGFYGGPYSDVGTDVLMDSSQGQIFPVILATTAAGQGSQVEGFHDGGALYDTDSWLFKLGNFNTIRGIAYIDYNLNGIKDANEPFYKRGVFTTTSGTIDSINSYNQNGDFRFKVFQNSYTTRLLMNDTAYQVQPAFHNSVFTSYFNTDSFAFVITIRPGLSDISTAAYALKSARAGFETIYEGILTNRGGDTVRNKQFFFLKDKKLTYITATPAPTRISGDSVIWQYAQLRPSDTLRYAIRLKPGIPPQVQLGDTLKSYFIAPLTTDADSTNNIAPVIQNLIGSYDPNDKSEMHNGELQVVKATEGEFLTYIIRFQNTGNASAINVIITDTLDTQLNGSSLEILKTSHAGAFSMNKRQLQWVFQNIYLPDSTTNEPASHGYIIYRIKTNKNVVPNSFVHNRAAIYFDYNPPVITASARTLLYSSVTALPGSPAVRTNLLKLFPNPARSGNIFLVYDGTTTVKATIEIFTPGGRLIRSIAASLQGGSVATNIESGDLMPGIYFLRISGKNINETHPVLFMR